MRPKIINLLPESELKELKLEFASKQLRSFFAAIIFSFLVFIVAAFCARLLINSEISANNAVISELQTKINSSDNQALQKEILSLNSQIKNIKSITQQHYYWSKALIELGNVSPGDIHLNLVSADRSTGQIVVNGVADKRDSVLQFWSNVKKSTIFTNINFPLNNLETPTDTPFTFSFNVNPKYIQGSK